MSRKRLVNLSPRFAWRALIPPIFAFRLDIPFRPVRNAEGDDGIYHSGKNAVEYGRGMCSIYSLRAYNKSDVFDCVCVRRSMPFFSFGR